jgi:hypothetical protein
MISSSLSEDIDTAKGNRPEKFRKWPSAEDVTDSACSSAYL